MKESNLVFYISIILILMAFLLFAIYADKEIDKTMRYKRDKECLDFLANDSSGPIKKEDIKFCMQEY